MPYLFLLLLVVSLMICGELLKVQRKIICAGLFIILAFFSGFRYEVGTDYHSYEVRFDLISKGLNGEFSEYGYVLVVKLVQYLGGTMQLVFLIFACLNQYFIFKFIERYSFNRTQYFSIFIYLSVGTFFLGSLNLIRQSLTISLFAYSLIYIETKQLLKYLSIMALGAFFVHASLIVLTPCYFFLCKHINKTLKIVIAVVALLFGSLFFRLLLASPYAVYAKLNFTHSSISLSIIFAAICLFVLSTERFSYDTGRNALYNMNFISLVILVLMLTNSSLSSEIFLRMNNYFMVSLIILIPLIINSIKDSSIRTCILLTVSSILCLYFIRNAIILGESTKLLPYSMNFKLFQWT
jgi:hypothetical protein